MPVILKILKLLNCTTGVHLPLSRCSKIVISDQCNWKERFLHLFTESDHTEDHSPEVLYNEAESLSTLGTGLHWCNYINVVTLVQVSLTQMYYSNEMYWIKSH